MELLPEVNRNAVDRLERYKSELQVVEQSVKKHKMKVDKLDSVVKKTHVGRLWETRQRLPLTYTGPNRTSLTVL